jgi:hypothetical protein
MTTIHTRLMFNDVALFVYSYPRRCPSVFLFLLLVQQRAILYMYVVQAAVGDDHVSSCLLGTNNGLIAKKKKSSLTWLHLLILNFCSAFSASPLLPILMVMHPVLPLSFTPNC